MIYKSLKVAFTAEISLFHIMFFFYSSQLQINPRTNSRFFHLDK